MNAKKEIDGFTFYTYRDQGYLCIDSKNISGCLSYAETKGIKAICIDWIRGYWNKDVDFLVGKDFEKLLVNIEKIEDVNGINHLSNLSTLYIGGKKLPQTIDLKNSEKLKELAIEWTDSVTGKENLPNLEYLSIAVLTLPQKDLTTLGDFPSLTELHLTGGNLQTLEGVQSYPGMRVLELADMRSLKSFGAGTTELQNMTDLTVINCKKLPLQEYASGTNIQKLEYQEGGTVDTLSWLPEAFPNLEYFDFWATKVADGNLTPLSDLKRLKQVRFRDAKHYSAKCEAMNEVIQNGESLAQVFGEPSAAYSASESKLPTSEWEKEGMTKSHITKVEKVLSAFMHALQKPGSLDTKLNLFEVAVKGLDRLQLENGHFLDTDQRTQLVEFFNEQAHRQGIDQYDDITWEWREEW